MPASLSQHRSREQANETHCVLSARNGEDQFVRRRAYERAARRWWRLPERSSRNRHAYVFLRVDEMIRGPGHVGPMFRALVATAPAEDPEALGFLGASWFEDVLSFHGDRAEELLLWARLPASVWAAVLAGTYEEDRQAVPRLAAFSRQA